MKKFFTLLAIVAISLTSCKNNKPVNVIPTAKSDYTEIVNAVPDTVAVHYYELEMQLSNPILNIENATLLNSRTVIQAGMQVVFIDRTYNKSKIATEHKGVVDGIWFGDHALNFDELKLDLPDAIQRLKETNIVLPVADKVTLRKPISPPFRPMYIFGTMGTFFISVDAITGDVSKYVPVSFSGINSAE